MPNQKHSFPFTQPFGRHYIVGIFTRPYKLSHLGITLFIKHLTQKNKNKFFSWDFLFVLIGYHAKIIIK